MPQYNPEVVYVEPEGPSAGAAVLTFGAGLAMMPGSIAIGTGMAAAPTLPRLEWRRLESRQERKLCQCERQWEISTSTTPTATLQRQPGSQLAQHQQLSHRPDRNLLKIDNSNTVVRGDSLNNLERGKER